MAQARRRWGTTQESAATNARTFRTFLLMQQFAATEIGARIVQARKERGLTQDELADLVAGFGKRSLQEYEAGNVIPYKHFDEIAMVLGRPKAWFLYGDEHLSGLTEERLREILNEEMAEFRTMLERLAQTGSAARGGAGEEQEQTG